MAAQVVEAAKELAAKVGSPGDDQLIKDERANLELDKLQAEVDSLNESLRRERDLHSFRKVTLVALLFLVVCWLGSVVCAVWLSGRYGNELHVGTKPEFVFKLSDPVLVAFISSTTVSVIGIFVIAAKWLFPSTASNGASKKNG